MTWRSKKQNVISLSNAKVECCALHHAITDLSCLKILLTELGFSPKKPIVLFCDNTVAIAIVTNPLKHDKIKHIKHDRNYITYNLKSSDIKVLYIKTLEYLADIMV